MVMCWAAGDDAFDIDRNGVVDMKSIGLPIRRKELHQLWRVREGGLRYISFLDEEGNALFQVDTIRTDKMADDSEGMAAFGNRGPSQE